MSINKARKCGIEINFFNSLKSKNLQKMKNNKMHQLLDLMLSHDIVTLTGDAKETCDNAIKYHQEQTGEKIPDEEIGFIITGINEDGGLDLYNSATDTHLHEIKPDDIIIEERVEFIRKEIDIH